MAGMTDTGLKTKRYTEIFDDIKKSIYQDLSPNLDVSEDSELGLFLASIVRGLADVHTAMSEIYDSGTIDKAEGFNLDDMTALNAVYRRVAQPTRGTIEFVGDSGAEVPETTRLVSTAGIVFYPTSNFTITPSSCVEATLEVNSLRPDTNYVIIINNIEYSYTTTQTDTVTTLLESLAGLINGGIVAKASVQGNSLRVYKDPDNVEARSNAMTVTATTFLSFTKVTTLQDVAAETLGANITLAGTLIEIENTVTGLDSVFNRYDLQTGSNKETDTELRQRYLDTINVTGVGTLDAIVSAVRRVQGVTDAFGEENDQDVVVDNFPAKSFKITVVGGQNDNIAQAIWDTKPAGILAYGDLFGRAFDISGVEHTVRFTRPTPKYVYIKVNYVIYDEESLAIPKADIEKVIAQSINNYGKTLKVGDDVILNRIFSYIYKDLRGVEVKFIRGCLENSQGLNPPDSSYKTGKLEVNNGQYTVWESAQYKIYEGD